jgi:hypothetical protein
MYHKFRALKFLFILQAFNNKMHYLCKLIYKSQTTNFEDGQHNEVDKGMRPLVQQFRRKN